MPCEIGPSHIVGNGTIVGYVRNGDSVASRSFPSTREWPANRALGISPQYVHCEE
ncbi:hypothetical protein BAUCODRAFT_31134 [Baudoinia panamericana UAMH 10762]|uniref:Uncharacterized protein n=1 Tax=Baudoinia panamericana (strain UAMH 10762) TaxID=717646 RepID=M2N4E8_BAUPA|nr:uncharacterized protein BAUCODRAFT_31134 [Baudoinia panamericana UAMH 10762]EMC98863.1 hypothetical protein BAUCODRAFT_31134 [Baudoinia panamericana UAMH 10762]